MYKILLIDDTPLVRKITEKILSPQYEVFSVSDWSQANQHIFRDKVDLVLMDVNMPGVNGDKIASVIKESNTGNPLKVVLFSALDSDHLNGLVKENSLDGYICKTSDPSELHREVRKYLPAPLEC